MSQHYLVALGSNQPHPRHGPPRKVLIAALAALEGEGLSVRASAPIRSSAPLGPSLRTYANGAALIETALEPPELLALLQQIEDRFGRNRRGQRWRARVLDIDIVLWSGGAWSDPHLTIPHPLFRERHFVLKPAAAICPLWRDPLSGLTLRQLAARHHRALTRPHPLP